MTNYQVGDFIKSHEDNREILVRVIPKERLIFVIHYKSGLIGLIQNFNFWHIFYESKNTLICTRLDMGL